MTTEAILKGRENTHLFCQNTKARKLQGYPIKGRKILPIATKTYSLLSVVLGTKIQRLNPSKAVVKIRVLTLVVLLLELLGTHKREDLIKAKSKMIQL